MKKKILEHSWLELEKYESNPTQTWRRIRDEMVSAIDDIILLAQKFICIFDSHGNMTHQDELVVKPADNYSNDVNLFEKNKGNRKRRR